MIKKAKKAQRPEIVEREYSRYIIKAGMLQDTIVARAFPKPPSKFRHLVAEASGKSANDAIERLIEKLEALRMERRSLRREDPSLAIGVPTTEEYADALRSLSPGPKLLRVLHDHAMSRRRGMRVADLAKEGEFSSVQDLMTAYERLGTDIFKVIEPDDVIESGLSVVIHVPECAGLPADGVAALQPELQDALLHLLGSERRSA